METVWSKLSIRLAKNKEIVVNVNKMKRCYRRIDPSPPTHADFQLETHEKGESRVWWRRTWPHLFCMTILTTAVASALHHPPLSTTKRKPFFRLHNQETATIYESPISWSAPKILFLEYDAQFISEHLGNQLPVTPNWENVETVRTRQTLTVPSVVQADTTPTSTHCTKHYESEIGCTGNRAILLQQASMHLGNHYA